MQIPTDLPLTDATGAVASEVIREIASQLIEKKSPEAGMTASRKARKSDAFAGLFAAYADAADLVAHGFDACAAVVDSCLTERTKRPALNLYAGWAGLGWITTHLEAQDEFVASHVDRLLFASLPKWPRRLGYDLISGLVGAGVYFVERLPNDSAKRGLGLILDVLDNWSVHTDEGTTWLSPPQFLPAWQRERAPNGYFNLGVAHGVPGVCWLLGKIFAAGIEPGRTAGILRRTLRWLRSNQPDPTVAELATWIGPGVERKQHHRMAWCYGPLGASAVALGAARAIGDAESQEWAQELALACADVAPQDAGVRDAGLCHGAAGNAQMFLRLYRNSGIAKYGDAALVWLRVTLDYREPGKGVGGYRMWGETSANRQGWVDDGSFLTGSAGVGLMLLAMTTEIEPKWDRLLLLS